MHSLQSISSYILKFQVIFVRLPFEVSQSANLPKDCLEFGKLSNDKIKQNSEPTFVKGWTRLNSAILEGKFKFIAHFFLFHAIALVNTCFPKMVILTIYYSSLFCDLFHLILGTENIEYRSNID